jgi:hypothetical protein
MQTGASARSDRVPRAALCLLTVLLIAKVIVLWRAGVSVGAASWPAFVWQDIAVALAVAVVEKTRPGLVFSRKSRSQVIDSKQLAMSSFGEKTSPGLVFYAAIAVYVAVNVAVAGVLSSPLTWPMIRAARGPLADSISLYLTAPTLVPVIAVLLAGALAPLLFRHLRRAPRWLVALSIATAVVGAAISPRVDTRGFDRNALTALVVWPRVSAAVPTSAAWRDSAFEPAPAPQLIETGAARGMNVVIVILESTAAQYLKMYGAAENPMPALERIGQTSLVFDAAYAAYPESIKGLYAAMCARSPRFGATMEATLAAPDGPCDSPARAFGRAGYATSLFHSGRFGYLGMDALVASLGFDTLADAGTIGGHVQSSFGVDEAATIASTLAWIDATAGKPFFTVYMPAAGHHPYASNLPGPFAGDDDLSRYRNALHETDAALASLVAGLDARGQLARTMLIVFGDHGEAFGQHPGNVGHTLFIHDENVHVPYLISIPGVTTRQTHVPSPVSVLDTAPTLFDLAGLPPSSGTEGRSLLAPGARIAPFFADYSLGWLGLRDGCWKYQFNINATQSHLFNVCEDPAESIDRASEQHVRVATYRKTVTNWK